MKHFDVTKIDWSELRNQKRTLIGVIDEIDRGFKSGLVEDDKISITDDLTGILNLIDAIQDHAVDNLGVASSDVYDFELEEQRDAETIAEKFARENAQTIFEICIESEGLYIDEEMSKEFIQGIVDDPMHASAIKNIMRLEILNDIECIPDTFTWEDGKPIYDYTMMDYGDAISEYCREIYYESKTKTLWLCGSCGSDCVESHAMVNPNAPTVNPELINLGEPESNYCFDCQQKVRLIKSEIKWLKEVIGFQVVDNETGETYHNSNSIHSLFRARTLLKDVIGTHKLLTIWTGDVEDPIFYFSGDPRRQ